MNAQQVGTVMPHLTRPDAEMALLASMLLDPTAIEAAESVNLQPAHFYMVKHAAIFEAVLALREAGQSFDATAVVNELAHRKTLDQVGGAKYVYTIGIEQPYDPDHALTYATQIMRSHRLRSLIEYGAEITKRANGSATVGDTDGLLAWAEEQLQQIGNHHDHSTMLLGDETARYHDRVLAEAIANAAKGEPDLYPWPGAWYTWQKHIMPLDAGEVGLLAAGTGIGKSAYLECIAESWAIAGRQVVMVHFEDSHRYKLNRRLARHSGIPIASLKRGTMTADDQDRRRRAESNMASWAGRLHYLHTADWSMSQVCRELRTWVDAGRCEAVVLDYLDKAQADERQRKTFGANVYERQADDMERIKSFVEKVGIVAMTATQGNKQIDNAARATRQHIMGSGQKSHKAQLVLVLNRDIVDDQDAAALGVSSGSYSPIVTVRIDKQNQGETLEFRQRLDGPRFRIFDLEPMQ